MKKIKTALMGVVLATALPSFAAAACYSPREFEAEQGLRIHSELMVIALTCMKMPQGGQVLYNKYERFTRNNQHVLAVYESELISYFRRQGNASPEKQFHALRTGLANRISKTAINMSVASFCAQYGLNIDQAVAMDSEKFRRWARQPVPQVPTTYPVCRQ